MQADQPGLFSATRWSVVLAAGDSGAPGAQEALEKLCRAYWYPLYAYVRRQGHSPEDAQDLTQAFFARFLEKKYLRGADRERGRFRSFLLTSLKNFLVNEWEKARAEKRGGFQTIVSWDEEPPEDRYRAEPADEETPETLYEKRWAVALLENVLARLRREFAASGKQELFEQFKVFLWGEKSGLSYASLAAQTGTSEGAIKVGVHRLRHRYLEVLRAEVAQTVATPAEVEEELRHLITILSR